MNEAERQRRFLARLLAATAEGGDALALHEGGERARHGHAAYRANADASAARALATAYPTVQQLVGEHDFAILARDHWRDAPPQRGDLGEWGEGFPDAIEADARLSDWPYLADCARLDWALHRCERAADATFAAASMARLGDTDPSRLVIELRPGVAAIVSRWPIALIHAAHRGDDPQAFDAVSEAIAAGRGEAVVVARDGWKAVPRTVDAPVVPWMQRLAECPDLAAALDDAPTGFDFAAWLADAIARGWLKGIRVLSD
jgi:hypothetical protein